MAANAAAKRRRAPQVDPADLGATELARRIAAGEIGAEAATGACLARIAERDPEILAWAFLDSDLALEQARRLDKWRDTGRALGPLHGVPVGVKDIVDTKDMPTECGSPILAGRKVRTDAALVTRLRAAGAVVIGKTVTTEFAYFHPGKTRNPHNGAHTPGGSSSGSAAAVAASTIPLAIGTQTNGSVIRPASFCGVYGFKPTHGEIPRTGVLTLSPFLDTVGVFARSIEDAALLADALAGYDDGDSGSRLQAAPRLGDIAATEPPVKPDIALVKTPVFDRADPDTQQGFAELREALGDRCEEVALPDVFAQAWDWQQTVMAAEMAKHLAGHYQRGRDAMSAELVAMIEKGRAIAAVDYLAAMDWRTVLNAGLGEIFTRFNAIVTPAAVGEAPEGLETTGDPAFCTLWTYLGVPALTVPLLTGAKGLPIGVQIVGPRNDDARLLRTARWLVRELAKG